MRADSHSFADLDQGRQVALDLTLSVDFSSQRLQGSARLQLERPADGPLDLDCRGLEIHSVTDDQGQPLRFELGATDPVLGERLRIHRDHPIDTVVISYRTGPDASALLWLSPAQTDGGQHPFVLTQCQAIHTRSIVPLQDTPRARLRYDAHITIPAAISAVMSAAPGERGPGPTEDTATLHFSMPQPIPPYLMALAVGELDSRDLGPRTRVYAEPGVVEAAAWEFAGIERMLAAAEDLFGPYEWERFDFIVLPPSFPMGGMENPRMTFLTPTLIAGDRSLVNVLAHELAHSWTGNLVTNATDEDFWLNEGWTVYAERRILEALEGAEVATQQAVLGRVELDEAMAERVEQGRSNALTYDQTGLDPDDEFSKLPYEKGFLLITALERAAGRPAFDAFMRAYIERFRFTSITTDEFVAFVRESLPGIDLELDAWTRDEGLRDDAPVFASPRLDALADMARRWPQGARPKRGWNTTETLYYLSQLPPLDPAECAELVQHVDLGTNAELRSAWLAMAARAGVPGIEPELRAFVGQVGRTKLIRPVVAAMVGNPALAPLARQVVDENAARLHISTRNSLEALF